MENKETKQYYIKVNGQRVEVTEEVYRAYVRPVNASQRAARRNGKCLVKGKRSGLVRCTKDCSQCHYYMAGNKMLGGVLSLDTLGADGYEEQSPTDIEGDLIEQEEKVLQTAALYKAIGKLNERQQYIVREIYYKGKTCEEVARILGVDGSAVRHALQRILAALRKNFEKD